MDDILREHKFVVIGGIVGLIAGVFMSIDGGWREILGALTFHTVWGAILGGQWQRPQKRLPMVLVALVLGLVGLLMSVQRVEAEWLDHGQTAVNSFMIGGIFGSVPGLVWQNVKKAVLICSIIGLVLGFVFTVIAYDEGTSPWAFVLLPPAIALAVDVIFVPLWLWFSVVQAYTNGKTA